MRIQCLHEKATPGAATLGAQQSASGSGLSLRIRQATLFVQVVRLILLSETSVQSL